MVKTKIAVLVSGGGTNLQAILDSMRAGKIPHGEIALVISNNRNAYALTRARETGSRPPSSPAGNWAGNLKTSY